MLVMKTTMININEAKTHLSHYSARVRKGERFSLCSRNKPFAELRPLRLDLTARRPFGLAKGRLVLPEGFNETDVDLEALFE